MSRPTTADCITWSERKRVPIPRAVALVGARCVGLTELMFSDERADVEAAKDVCEPCPASAECLGRAVAGREVFGVWAGFNMASQPERRRARERLAS